MKELEAFMCNEAPEGKIRKLLNNMEMTMKCVPHTKNMKWEVESVSIDSDKNEMKIDVRGSQVIDYLDTEIILK